MESKKQWMSYLKVNLGMIKDMVEEELPIKTESNMRETLPIINTLMMAI